MPSRDKITDADTLAKLLDPLDGWMLIPNDKIERKLEFKDFDEAIAFINAIAPLANDLDHHPEIFNVYNRVELVLTTHDADGLTEYDFTLAEQIDDVKNKKF